MVDQTLLVKQYKVMLAALNDIKDEVNSSLLVSTVQGLRAQLDRIDDIAGRASTVDLFNPHNRPGDAEREVEKMCIWLRSTYANPRECEV